VAEGVEAMIPEIPKGNRAELKGVTRQVLDPCQLEVSSIHDTNQKRNTPGNLPPCLPPPPQ